MKSWFVQIFRISKKVVCKDVLFHNDFFDESCKTLMDKLQLPAVNMRYVRLVGRAVVVSCNLSMKIYKNASKT